MLKLYILLFLTLVLVNGCHSVTTTPQSRLVDVGKAIENSRARDLRHLFRTENEIEELKKKHLCLLKVSRTMSSREIAVKDGMSLEDLILHVFGKEYDGQLRVISRDIIRQTPRETYEPEQQKSIQIHPGDLIFILARD
jgi:hypothetical protein